VSQLPAILDAVEKFITFFVSTFGVGGTVAVAVTFLLLSFGWRLYQDWRKKQEVNELVAEKERSIQRLAEDNRMWRALFLKQEKGLSDRQIESLIMRGAGLEDGPTTQHALEGEAPLAQRTAGTEPVTHARKG